jgi:hypothetical protein
LFSLQPASRAAAVRLVRRMERTLSRLIGRLTLRRRVAAYGQIQDLNHIRLSQAGCGSTESVRIGQM